MADVIQITKAFPATRERTVLLELLKTVALLRDRSIEVIICGGWVPFLKDLARRDNSQHSMSLDIDLVLPKASCTPETVDRLREALFRDLSFRVSAEASSKLEKRVGADLVQLDLLADAPRGQDGNAVVKIFGDTTSLDFALLDGGANLRHHLETIRITHQEDSGAPHTTEVSIPNAVGFLILKSEVTKFRQKDKDPYDIYYYCTHCEDERDIREKLRQSITCSGVPEAIERLRYLFQYPDSTWVARVLDHAKVQESEREREGQRIVRTIGRVIEGL
jgi:hypothetical protein